MKALLTIELFSKSKTDWRWRVVHRNGNLVCESAQGFTRQSDARRSAIRLTTALAAGEYAVSEP